MMHRRAIINEGSPADTAHLRDQVVGRCLSFAKTIDWRAAFIALSVQVGLLALLLSSIINVAPQKAGVGNAGISLFSLAATNEQRPVPPQPPDALRAPPPIVRVKAVSMVASVQPAPISTSDAMPAAGQACDIASLVGKALETDEQALASLIIIDSTSLPVSRATMLWDGQWVLPPSLATTSLFSPVQQSVIQAVLAAPLACQTEPMTGPQFIMLSGVNAGRTIVLVVGSGAWTWDQTLPSALPDNDQIEGEWSSLNPNENKINRPSA